MNGDLDRESCHIVSECVPRFVGGMVMNLSLVVIVKPRFIISRLLNLGGVEIGQQVTGWV